MDENQGRGEGVGESREGRSRRKRGTRKEV